MCEETGINQRIIKTEELNIENFAKILMTGASIAKTNYSVR